MMESANLDLRFSTLGRQAQAAVTGLISACIGPGF